MAGSEKKGPAVANVSASGERTQIRRRIGELLVDAELITEGQLSEALARQVEEGGKLGETLISLGYLTAEAFLDFISQQPGVASIGLMNYAIPAELVSLVPKDYAAQHEVFPIDKLGKLLTLGMVCPLDAGTIAELEQMTGLRVKALMCSPNDIRAAIGRYYPVEAPAAPGAGEPVQTDEARGGPNSALKLRGVARLIRRIESLPALPDTVSQVREVMADISTSARDVAAVIGHDPAIAVKVLGVANSAAYGFRHRVETIELAVSLLGLREVYNIVLSVAVVDLFDKNKIFNYKLFWREALQCATASGVIARACRYDRQNGLFAAGLLHDVGRLVLVETVPELYSRIPIDLDGEALILAEQDVIGLTHTEAGHELAQHWDLPHMIAQTIRFHHAPQQADQDWHVVAIVAVADMLARAATKSQAEQADVIEQCATAMETFGLHVESQDSRHMLEEIVASTEDFEEPF